MAEENTEESVQELSGTEKSAILSPTPNCVIRLAGTPPMYSFRVYALFFPRNICAGFFFAIINLLLSPD